LTIIGIQNHRPTVTEISPQYECPEGVFWTANDWKNVLLELFTNIENSTSDADAGSYWGGFMLNEEDGFWTEGNPTGSLGPARYEDLNEAATNLMLTAPGASWLYTELFRGAGNVAGLRLQPDYPELVSGA
jgi:hypothetical protein